MKNCCPTSIELIGRKTIIQQKNVTDAAKEQRTNVQNALLIKLFAEIVKWSVVCVGINLESPIKKKKKGEKKGGKKKKKKKEQKKNKKKKKKKKKTKRWEKKNHRGRRVEYVEKYNSESETKNASVQRTRKYS